MIGQIRLTDGSNTRLLNMRSADGQLFCPSTGDIIIVDETQYQVTHRVWNYDFHPTVVAYATKI